MNKYVVNNSKSQQKGATLIVSLVILTIVTILGLASMRNSNLELKMAASARDRGVAFQNAESALRAIEATLVLPVYDNFELAGKNCTNSKKCFTTTCDYGLCFTGDFQGEPEECSIAATGGVVTQMWKEVDWDDQKYYLTVNVPDSKDTTAVNEVKYIIEFMCFIPKTLKTKLGDEAPRKMLPLYRVTVRAQGESGRSSVMLQSVFKSSEV